MTILVYGGSGSGKSAFAEKKTTELNKGNKLYYLATMQVYDDEDRERIKRHRKLRYGKGFTTVEQPKNIDKILDSLSNEKCDVLLECMSNLVANEMFDGDSKDKSVFDKIKADITKLDACCDNLVLVSNNIFEDGITYDREAEDYKEILGNVNSFLSSISEEVWEVVAGIPVRLK
ncbi:MAG: bifunctional adenosylcobinamide kinase/adenosylcobinamide-phosphate guanylyltransferase [Lachnospiraceae bacterium]|nr:bifunctional adenosylcobinamide kinase/adenosylcobinamide-phosphate guanylyltransferase [Lachnospiraceae bacterium]